MPNYEYACSRCGPFTLLVSMNARHLPQPCPHCGRNALRGLAAPQLLLMPDGQRKAHAVNERSRHQPAVHERHRCSSRCGCGVRPGSKPLKSTQPRRARRPWMLGH